jgi:hypothetical protein
MLWPEAAKGMFFAGLAELARVEAKLAALKARLAAGYPHRPSATGFLSVPVGMI